MTAMVPHVAGLNTEQAAGRPVLELRGVSKSYRQDAIDVAAVRDADLVLRRGEVVALTGPSGCGKSTLLAIAGALMAADCGSVEVEGNRLQDQSVEDLAALRRRHIGFVFQELNLMPSLSALENVSLPLELDGYRRTQARRLAVDSLERVGAADLAHRFPSQLSGGQRQRIALARAVVDDRRLVLADEPTGALDSESARLVIDLLVGVARQGAGVLLVTHSASHAAEADRRVEMLDGRILAGDGIEPDD